jgi:hypothetical protein
VIAAAAATVPRRPKRAPLIASIAPASEVWSSGKGAGERSSPA